jgi:hypothetical protein
VTTWDVVNLGFVRVLARGIIACDFSIASSAARLPWRLDL